MAIVAIENLCKKYQMGSYEFFALRDVSLDIEEGEYIAIMGPSGSGKSTLLNILGGLDTPSSGTYHLAGKDVSKLNDNELSGIRCSKIGFIFQSYNLIAQLNVVENIGVPLYYKRVSESYSLQHTRQLAEMVGLGDRLAHLPWQLSGGQQQRVAIARSLANNPAIILADEPTGNLDSESGEEILNILDDLNRQGKTLIIVTHDEHIAKRAGRILHLLDGEISRQEYNHKR